MTDSWENPQSLINAELILHEYSTAWASWFDGVRNFNGLLASGAFVGISVVPRDGEQKEVNWTQLTAGIAFSFSILSILIVFFAFQISTMIRRRFREVVLVAKQYKPPKDQLNPEEVFRLHELESRRTLLKWLFRIVMLTTLLALCWLTAAVLVIIWNRTSLGISIAATVVISVISAIGLVLSFFIFLL